MIRVVDIFAGPGGLSEGFATTAGSRGDSIFEVALSIEKDERALETLRLRTFFRLFPDHPPEDYYRLLRGEINLELLYDRHRAEARLAASRCWNATLGPGGTPTEQVRRRIEETVRGQENWVLIGGPPCQAYSLAGRSRNLGNPRYDPAKDVRQRLYVEYLQILAEHRPAVFIMENVKGLLSATLQNERVFHRILEDLRDPAVALSREGRGGRHVRRGRYRIQSLTETPAHENSALEDSIVRAELLGVPQTRHRVILLGVREDITGAHVGLLRRQAIIPAGSALMGLPRLRSGLSPISRDSAKAWRDCLRSQTKSRWVNAGTQRVGGLALSNLIRAKLEALAPPRAGRGAEFFRADVGVGHDANWFCDERIGGVCNHGSRAHMKEDLFRYFYAACYAIYHGASPSLKYFPTDLLPNHVSADAAVHNGGHFSDRFRVQLASRPSSTIVSHISKDGHYYIHPDPLQCRSLTVREAARLQTFPDNYFFCGNRTAQYTQVGNAVPPLLARQIGGLVRDILGP